jgi:putative endonuclease
MYYVYLIRSQKFPEQAYIGHTNDLKQRLETHNSGGSIHTKLYRPWQLIMFLAFETQEKALDFEKYMKSGAGRAFAKKRFW